MSNKIVQDTNAKISIHADALSLSQQDLPYDASVANRPASQKGFFAAADTITISGDLVNPGQEITLIAREIILAKQLVIDAGGPNPATTFKAGELPPQTNNNFGADGANGQNATAGLPAGSITVLAESIQLADANGSGATQLTSVDGLLQKSVAQAIPIIQKSPAIKSAPFPGLYINIPFLFNKILHLEMTDASVTGLQNLAYSGVQVSKADRALILELSCSNLVISSGKLMDGDMKVLGSVNSEDFSLDAFVFFVPGPNGYTLQRTEFNVPPITFKLDENSLQAVYVPKAGNGPTEIFKTLIGKEIIAQINKIAGSIPLWLYCQGGDGGRGQDGHDGITGEKGANGVKTSERGVMSAQGAIISTPEEAIGKPGKAGGQAGSAGHSYNAVAGGPVSFDLVKAINPSTFILSANGGIGGAKANPGQPGPGGEGGNGAECSWDVLSIPTQVESGVAAGGKDGAPGAAADFSGNQGVSGESGSAQFNGSALPGNVITFEGSNYDRLAAGTPLTTLQIKQQSTNLAYLNAKTAADYQSVSIGYQWLMQINAPFLNGQDPSGGKLSPDDIQVRLKMHQSAQTELARMQEGLDYYGHSINWVPVLSMNALKSRIQGMLDIGNIIETTYDKFSEKNATIEEQLDQLKTMQTSLKQAINTDNNEITKLDSQIADTSDKLAGLLTAINNQMDWIVQEQYDYKQQLEDYLLEQAFKCTWESFFKALFTIIKDTVEVVSGIGEVQEAISGFSEVKDIFGAAKQVVTVIKKAEATIKSIQEAYEAISPDIENDPNSAKILVDEKKFDDMVGQYVGKFPAAKEFKDAVDYYFTLIKSHNRLSLAYTGLWIQKLRLQADIKQKSAELENIAAQSVAGDKLIPPSVITFMYNAYWRTKSIILRELYQFNRAYEFWSLQSRKFLSSDATIANLAATYVDWSNDIDTFLEQSGPFQPYSETVMINADNAPAAFRLLVNSKRLDFHISIQDMVSYGFANMTHINATSVKIELPDITSDSQTAFLELTHTGTSQQSSSTNLSQAGSIHTFTHAARTIPYKIDYANPGNTAGGLIGDDKQGFPGLSPFTLWSLNFDLQGNDWIDLSKITQIKLTFSGKFLGPQ